MTATQRQAPPRSMPGPAVDVRQMSVVVITTAAALGKYLADIEALAASAIEPNVCYESWMIEPALKCLSAGLSMFFVLVYAPHPTQKLAPPVLCGFFPLTRERRFRGLPIPCLRLWEHKYCVLCTPLVRAESAPSCLAAFFDWLARGSHQARLVELQSYAGDGPFEQLLVDYFNQARRLFYLSECHTRALLRPAPDAEEFLHGALSGKHRKGIRLQESGLAQIGRVQYSELGPDGDVGAWLEDFLKLEAGGWKGREGTALASSQSDSAYFVAVATEAFHRGRLMMLALSVGGRPIAYRCSFLAGDGAFTFKIAFDEEFSRYSPGMLLEVENVRRMHARPEIKWMDSCTSQDNFMFNRLWRARRTIHTVLVGTGKPTGDLIVALFPLVKWLNRLLKVRRPIPASGGLAQHVI